MFLTFVAAQPPGQGDSLPKRGHCVRGGNIMGLGKSHLRVIANPDNPERLYRSLTRRHRRYMLQK
jgi:hypothetical protein